MFYTFINRKRLSEGTVPANKEPLTGTVPVNEEHLTDTLSNVCRCWLSALGAGMPYNREKNET